MPLVEIRLAAIAIATALMLSLVGGLGLTIWLGQKNIERLESSLQESEVSRVLAESNHAALARAIEKQNEEIRQWEADALAREQKIGEVKERSGALISIMEKEVNRLRDAPIVSCEDVAMEALLWVESLSP